MANFEKAWQLDPRNASVISNLAETYMALRRYGEAERVIESGLMANPNAHLFLLARATIYLRKDGDIQPFREALEKVPRDFDPGGSVTLMALRICLIEHDYERAGRILSHSSRASYNDSGFGGTAGMIDGYSFPKIWYEGLVSRARGQVQAARACFERAQRQVQAELMQWTDDPKTAMMLALIEAALGNKEKALGPARRAVELLPTSQDAYDGPILETNLAVIEAQVGQTDKAIERLTNLVRLPNGPTAGALRIEPEWEPLRADPRFEKLLSQ